MTVITAADNPKLKYVRKLLSSSKFRFQEKAYVVESIKQIQELPFANIRYILAGGSSRSMLPWEASRDWEIDERLIPRSSVLENFNGAVAVVKMPPEANLPLSAKQSAVMLDAIQDPGNLGTILRTCAAFAISDIWLGAGTCDPYAPKVVRASGGTLHQLNLYRVKNWQAVNALGYNLLLLDPQASLTPATIDWARGPWGIIVGNEGHGAAKHWPTPALTRLRIPQEKQVDSLNVAIALGIIAARLYPAG